MINAGDIITAYATDSSLRHLATSGGIGSRIIKELFTNHLIESAVSYEFNKDTKQYEPKIIYSWNDYVPVGSIYHEIELFKFIKENVCKIRAPFLFTALPCQAAAIKKLLDRNGIESYIIELTCSSQQSYEATEYLLHRAKIDKKDVMHIKYRGGGWPGGVTITMVNGETVFFDNNKSVWTKIFHSKIFSMPRCFFCHATREAVSDIQISDPWGIDSCKTEKEGRTLCRINSQRFSDILNRMSECKEIEYKKEKKESFWLSQMGTIVSKNYNIRHPKLTRAVKSLVSSSTYRRIVLGNELMFNAHFFFYKNIFKILHKIAKITNKDLMNYKP